ncbi:MAG: cyclase family protein [Saprospiraceae bacterium]|nr:cyclase family protein [Saprospiraceae bacterium]MCF8250674.1 cyclase family protein [Saprospiraceae bacterium]MCF8280812.1 cyclase family protein [Bacteroidales bacterium]MCF8312526.1 cyclase family protein [Saprospiraceae bacterium]MCF8440794.1 cyclase family protein [Saprospiraceae bacterium]
MKIKFENNGLSYTSDLSHPLDLSIPLRAGLENPNCYWAPPVEIWPVVAGDFVGDTNQGGAVNFKNITLNPHGNGTHTECVGHISTEKFTINECLTSFHFLAKLATVYPTKMPDGDRVVLRHQLEELVQLGEAEAFILRTLPNDDHKLTANYSGTNPPYFHHEAVDWLVQCGIQHLLLDLPSVDREEDGGKLLAHRAFWRYGGQPADIRKNCTITELIFVGNDIQDGVYLLNLQITSLELDASPSKPVLFEVKSTK